MAAQKLSGSYFTPQPIVEALVCWAVARDSDRLLDPSCGDGRFLAAHHNSVGIEQDASSAQSAIDRAPWALVHEGDFFQWAEATPERFECCSGNPPFIRYQHFKGAIRSRALKLCEREGARFTGLTSSWAPFLVATASLLKPGGRMAFVVPAEIGHAPYATPLMEYLVRHFSTVQVVAIREKLFPLLSEDCWLLYADGFGGSTEEIRFSTLERFKWSAKPPSYYERVPVSEWRTQWNRRLRPYIVRPELRNIYAEALRRSIAQPLASFARIGIGYVSGDNDFFHLRPSEAEHWQIPEQCLHPTVRNGRSLPKKQITAETVRAWRREDQQILLLRLGKSETPPNSVQRYLDSASGRVAREAFKCRTRSPWYSVPDVQVPDYVLTYMSGRMPQLVKNDAAVTCTNTVHSVRITDRLLANKFLPSWSTAFAQLSCELEGHPLGGGMLKLEVREAARVLFIPAEAGFDKHDSSEVRTGLSELRRWRHYAE